MSATTTVLLVEDHELDDLMIPALLEKAPEGAYSVERAGSLRDAIARVHNKQFDVILLDLALHGRPGLDAVARLKAADPSVAIVVLSVDDGDEQAIEAIQRGAQEYVSKEHLTAHRLTGAIRRSITRQQQLEEAQAEALTDPLTGIGNRRALQMELRRRLAEWRRRGTAFCVALFDLDHFKSINDTYGHDAGDEVLRNMAAALRRQTRYTELAVRYGGEQFAMVFPATRLDEALRACQRIRHTMGKTRTHFHGKELTITASAGLTEVVVDDFDQSVLRRAAAALQAAKRAGRNCCHWDDGQSTSEMLVNN